MNKKLTGLIMLLLVIVSTTLFYGFKSVPDTNLVSEPTAKEKSEKFEKLKKDFDMSVSEITTKPVISKSEAIKIAKPYVNGITYKTKVKAFHVKLTDKRIAIGGFISQEAADANPKLKGKQYPEDVSVWLVTYEGIHALASRGAIITETNVVIDDVTGKMLYGFN